MNASSELDKLHQEELADHDRHKKLLDKLVSIATAVEDYGSSLATLGIPAGKRLCGMSDNLYDIKRQLHEMSMRQTHREFTRTQIGSANMLNAALAVTKLKGAGNV